MYSNPSHRRWLTGLRVAVLLMAAAPSLAAEPSSPAPVFESEVLPILTAHCFKCHGLEARKASLDLRSVGLMLRGGENGAVIAKGSSKDSPLYARIADCSMPPEKELPLTEAKIELIRRWLDAGAPTLNPDSPLSESEAPAVTDENLRILGVPPLQCPPVPTVSESTSIRTPIDAFVVASLAAKGLTLNVPADRVTLLRLRRAST